MDTDQLPVIASWLEYCLNPNQLPAHIGVLQENGLQFCFMASYKIGSCASPGRLVLDFAVKVLAQVPCDI